MIESVKTHLLDLQKNICEQLETIDGQANFIQDRWQKTGDNNINGRTNVLRQGGVFEQAGVAFSQVSGEKLPLSALSERPELANCPFQAVGVSLVIHPNNPYVPTTHANFRFFISEQAGKKPIWWFGGGFDLTPYYGFKEDVIHWHNCAKNACTGFGEDTYQKYKQWCDRYFYIKHRQEPRGVGGLFFDNLNEWGFESCFAFLRSTSEQFLLAYLPIVDKRQSMPFGDRERQFQLYRRGRYVEFNLVYDRGTLFGLQTNGRTESILMSLPPLVRWQYQYQVEKNSPEAALYDDFLVAKDWLTE